jgi:hypothetical protein
MSEALVACRHKHSDSDRWVPAKALSEVGFEMLRCLRTCLVVGLPGIPVSDSQWGLPERMKGKGGVTFSKTGVNIGLLFVTKLNTTD